ncbi:MAG: hypothetical protein JRD05_13250 [Deltaproteobacteria bacterium]|nr:hypothetical protein [Deltaproteobacteria bacterium]
MNSKEVVIKPATNTYCRPRYFVKKYAIFFLDKSNALIIHQVACYWILDAGYWMLDAGCWMLDKKRVTSNEQRATSNE